jgi:tripartite-type tricarboxylate transporter receptor subunit TctC
MVGANRSALAVICLIALATPVLAQSYPSKPIRIVVPFAVGGPADIYARFVGQKLLEELKQPFVVDNRPGAGSVLGTAEVARASPDGHTLLMMSNTHTTNESLVPNKTYKLMSDFVPIAPVNSSDLVMVVHPSVPAASLQEFSPACSTTHRPEPARPTIWPASFSKA